MPAIFILIISALIYIIAYKSYGVFLSRIVFHCHEKNNVPSHEFADGKDYVSSHKSIMFGHHFTSIAGTGPIVGPAIAIIWGWVPALCWILLGSILIGAFHDFAVLILSVRNKGKSIAKLSQDYLGPQLKQAFYLIIFIALWIVIAIFGLIMALIFAQFPTAVLAILLEIPIAIAMGYCLMRKKGNLFILSCIAVCLLYVAVYISHHIPIVLPTIANIPSTGIWTIILLGSAFITTLMPVSWLLQPRDFLNAWQLYIALGFILIGILILSIKGNPLYLHAPALNISANGAPPIWPFLFMTLACGAISGFHSLICSGTTAKQLNSEKDAQAVGYGAMLSEGFLAILMLIAVSAGLALGYQNQAGELLQGLAAWETHYGSWQASAGLGSKLSAVVIGCANFLKPLGFSQELAITLMGVLIASFAGTTLDSATRVQRYIIHEICQQSPLKNWITPLKSCLIAIFTAAALAFSSGLNGKGALGLWPLFGAVNQLLAALALLIVTCYLIQKKRPYYLLSLIPCLFLSLLSIWASLHNQIQFLKASKHLLLSMNSLILILSIIILCKGAQHIKIKRRQFRLAQMPR